MNLGIDFENLTVDGYRNAIDTVFAKQPHKKAIQELSDRFNSVRPVQVRTAYLLSQGEPLRNACVYAGFTPFLFHSEWMPLPSFSSLMSEIAPQYCETIEAMDLSKKGAHQRILNEQVKRALLTLETAGMKNEAKDPMLATGVLLMRKKSVNGQIDEEFYLNPACKWLDMALQKAGELEGLYKVRAEEVPDDIDSKGITKIIFKDVEKATDHVAREIARSN